MRYIRFNVKSNRTGNEPYWQTVFGYESVYDFQKIYFDGWDVFL